MCSKESTGREYKCEKAVGLRLTCSSKAVSKGSKVRPRAGGRQAKSYNKALGRGLKVPK